jgi:hypothetical protein
MKLVAKVAEDPEARDDPRPMSRALWNRAKVVIEKEFAHPAWGCKLYEMQREGLISMDAMRAGDKYHQAYLDWRKWQAIDPEEFLPERRQFLYGKIKWSKRKLKEMTDVLTLLRNKYVEDIVIHEEWPPYYWQKMRACEALEELAIFLCKGTKRVRKGAKA